MSVDAAQIEARIRAVVPDARVTVHDTTGGGDHWSAVVITDAFEGKTLVERHRVVYGALGEWMRAEIHALALTTQTTREANSKT